MLLTRLAHPDPTFFGYQVIFDRSQKRLFELGNRLTFQAFTQFQIKSGEKTKDGYISVWQFPRSAPGMVRRFRKAYLLESPYESIVFANAEAKAKLNRRTERRIKRRMAAKTAHKIAQQRSLAEQQRRRMVRTQRQIAHVRKYRAKIVAGNRHKLAAMNRKPRTTD